MYDLVAVCNHYGRLDRGHYTAYCCDSDGAWLRYDDAEVSSLDAARVQSRAAYMLFYCRRRAEAAADPGEGTCCAARPAALGSLKTLLHILFQAQLPLTHGRVH